MAVRTSSLFLKALISPYKVCSHICMRFLVSKYIDIVDFWLDQHSIHAKVLVVYSDTGRVSGCCDLFYVVSISESRHFVR